ncbi:MAG: domain S-box-containing protein [Acidobacteria bacterium]|nr:domain S-box-containing protein [Acidobacteriota bacterium]
MLEAMSEAGKGGRAGLPLSLAAVVVLALASAAVRLIPGGLLPPWTSLALAAGAAVAALLAIPFAARLLGRLRTVEQELVQEQDRSQRVADAARRESKVLVTAEGGREPVVLLRDLRVVAANQAAVRALDLKQVGELLGRRLADFAPADERARLERFLVGRMAGTSAPEQFRASLVTARGGRVSVEVATEPTEQDGIRYEQVSWRDVTGRERAEAILQSIVNNVPAGVVLCDPAGRVSWTNRQFVERTQWRSDYFFGRPLLPMVLPPDRRRAKVLLARARRGSDAEAMLRVSRRDGEVVLAAVHAVPLEVAGDLAGVIFIGTDVTEQVRSAEHEDQASRGEVLAELARNVAHRLNNDFQALLGLLEQLKQEAALGDLRRAIEERVAGAAGDLQLFVVVSRTGSSTLQPLRLGGLVDRWVGRVQGTLPAGVSLSGRRSLQEDRVIADPAQLELVLDLALSAAVGELGGRGGVVEVSLEPSADGNGAVLALSDTGELLESVSAAAAGRRLPLLSPREVAAAVAELVAHRHEGRADSKLQAGIGHRLWLELPLRRRSVPRPKAAHAGLRTGAILIAEDEETVRVTLAGALRELGHEVVEAANGAEALQRVQADPDRFALVVLDLVMPVTDGREVLHHLQEEVPELPVLICTGYDPGGDETLAAAAVLTKPFTIGDFLTRIQDLMVGEEEGPGGDGARMTP